jgi:hypothetical protein
MEAAVKTVMTSLPGKVVSYDPATKLATVEPMVHNGNPIKPIPDVPVKWPRFGGYRLIGPLNVGDEVTLHFYKWDPSRFRVSGERSQSNAVREAGIYAIAVPGSETEGSAYNGGGGDGKLHLGIDNAVTEIKVDEDSITLKAATVNLVSDSPSDAAALASKVNAALTKIQSALAQCATAFTAINAIAPNTGAAGVNGAMLGFDAAVASTKVKLS